MCCVHIAQSTRTTLAIPQFSKSHSKPKPFETNEKEAKEELESFLTNKATSAGPQVWELRRWRSFVRCQGKNIDEWKVLHCGCLGSSPCTAPQSFHLISSTAPSIRTETLVGKSVRAAANNRWLTCTPHAVFRFSFQLLCWSVRRTPPGSGLN